MPRMIHTRRLLPLSPIGRLAAMAIAVNCALIGPALAGSVAGTTPALATVAPVPLPSSALMGAVLLGGLAAFARFPTGRRQHRRHRVG